MHSNTVICEAGNRHHGQSSKFRKKPPRSKGTHHQTLKANSSSTANSDTPTLMSAYSRDTTPATKTRTEPAIQNEVHARDTTLTAKSTQGKAAQKEQGGRGGHNTSNEDAQRAGHPKRSAREGHDTNSEKHTGQGSAEKARGARGTRHQQRRRAHRVGQGKAEKARGRGGQRTESKGARGTAYRKQGGAGDSVPKARGARGAAYRTGPRRPPPTTATIPLTSPLNNYTANQPTRP